MHFYVLLFSQGHNHYFLEENMKLERKMLIKDTCFSKL